MPSSLHSSRRVRQPISISADSTDAPLVLDHSLWYASLLGQPLAVRTIRASLNRSGLQPDDVALLRLVDRVCGGGHARGLLGEGRASWDGEAREGSVRGEGKRWEAQPRGGRTSVGRLVLAVMPLLLFPPRIPGVGVDLVDASSDDDDDDDSAGSLRPLDDPRPDTPPLSPPLSMSSTSCFSPPRAPVCCPSTLLVSGGSTSSPPSPSPTYLSLVLLPFLHDHFAIEATLNVARPGYPPAGGAVVSLAVNPLSPAHLPLAPMTLRDRGPLERITVHAWLSGRKAPTHALTRLTSAVVSHLRRASRAIPRETPIDIVVARGRQALPGPGLAEPTTAQANRLEVGVCLVGLTEGGCRLGVERTGEGGRWAPEEVGARAAEGLVEEFEGAGCVDSTLQALVLPYLLMTGTTAPTPSSLSAHPRPGGRPFTPRTSPRALSRRPTELLIGPPTPALRAAITLGRKLTGARVDLEPQQVEVDKAEDGGRGGWVLRCWGVGWPG